jgi:DNA-binding IclR family transcriptional regulator
MAAKKTHRLLETLQGLPCGLTAKDVADLLGADTSNISSQLSKLAAYGIIKKTRGRLTHDGTVSNIYYLPTWD